MIARELAEEAADAPEILLPGLADEHRQVDFAVPPLERPHQPPVAGEVLEVPMARDEGDGHPLADPDDEGGGELLREGGPFDPGERLEVAPRLVEVEGHEVAADERGDRLLEGGAPRGGDPLEPDRLQDEAAVGAAGAARAHHPQGESPGGDEHQCDDDEPPEAAPSPADEAVSLAPAEERRVVRGADRREVARELPVAGHARASPARNRSPAR